MNILRIFGIVVAVHVAAFMFVFAIPGCRSTTRRAPSPSETNISGETPKVYYPGLTGYSTTTPAPAADGSSPVSNADLNPAITPAPVDFSSPVQSPEAAPSVRFNPTRPNTPTASALQTASVTDVQRVTTYTVASGDSLWTVARKHNVTVAELREANNLKSDALSVGKKLIIPSKAPATNAAEAGVTGDTMTYTVKSGDSLGAIARRSGTTPGAIKTLNKLKNDSITVGQKLILPANNDTAAALAATPAPSPVAKSSAGDAEYVIQSNDTLESIARRFGVTQRSIANANHIADPRKIRTGQKLIIPGGAGAHSSTPGAAVQLPAQTPAPAPTTPAPQPEPEAPVSPVAPSDSSPISAPSSQPPIVPVEGSPVSPGT